jgi:cellulose 1,4-beta-cellobiosidase
MKISKVGRLSLVLTILVAIMATVIGVSSASAQTVCSPATAISVPYAKDGVGDVCLQATSVCGYINSWNLSTLQINGTSYLNQYVAGPSIPALNGGYTIRYVSTVAWGHFEIGGTCSATTPVTPATVTRTNTPVTPVTPVATFTRTRTPTSGPSLTPTRTATRTNTPTTCGSCVITATKTATRTNTPVTPVITATKTATQPIVVTVTKTPTTGPTAIPGTHLANPFSGAVPYVNQHWQGSGKGYQVNTSVWMDTIAAVNGTDGYPLGLAGHLDAALAQGANLISIVVYNLPGRDCAALASNGLLPATEAGLTTYKTQYIDVIASIVSQAKYANLRVIAIIEPDSLPNLVTNLSDADCANVNSLTLYQRGTSYSLSKFKPVTNMYTYIDIGHAGWLGWPSNFQPAITLIANVIKAGNAAGNCTNCVDGFADGTANTQVETETFLDAQTQVGGAPVRSQSYFDWNDYIDESHYAAAWKTAMQAAGIAASSTNMVLDTSRNGWGGCGGGPYALQTCRPTATSTSTDLTTYVNQSRIDRRPAKGNWCNQNGAGLGKLPLVTAAVAPYQAYLWIKPPAESDGSSSLIPTGPDNPDGKGFDGMCDPNYMGNGLNQNKNSNALPNAPVSGRWFQAQWDQLVANKFP